MSANLELEIRPKSDLTSATQATQRLYARAAFVQEVPNPELDSSGKPGEPLKVTTAVTGELTPNGTAALLASDGVAGSSVTVSIETAQGAELARTEAKFPADTKTGHFVFEVPIETYRSAGEPSIPEETPLLERSG